MPLATQDISIVCRKTVNVPKRHGLSCCLVGGAATTLWGVPRIPNVHFRSLPLLRALKRSLGHRYCRDHCSPCQRESGTSTCPGRSRLQTQVIDKPSQHVHYFLAQVPVLNFNKCRVDVLVPGIMNIPSITASRFVWLRQNTIPSMPLLPLLLPTLQAWSDHHSASYCRPDLRETQFNHIKDINILLPIVKGQGIRRSDGVGYLLSLFLSATDIRVRSYVYSYPSTEH
jgi:hypothetical protein